MNILLYVNSHLPRIGGRELVVHNLALQFANKGHRVVVAGASGYRTKETVDYGYTLVRWPILGVAPEVSRIIALGLYSLRNRFDVIHAHSTYPCGYVAGRLRRVLKAPLVITPHGEDINVVKEIGFGQRLDPHQAPKIEWAVRNANINTAISDTVEASLVEAGVDSKRIVRIPNGVDLERFEVRSDAQPYLDTLRIPPGAKVVTTIGNYHPRKGQELFVKAVAAAHRVDSRIHGVLVGRTSSTFCDFVRDSGWDQCVHFAGTLPVHLSGSSEPDHLAALLSSSAVYVSASIDEGAEGLSLALLEAMAARTCPIVTNISGNRDVIEDGQNGFIVEPNDDRAMTDAILAAVADDALRSRVASSARITSEKFSWSAIADRYLDIYSGLR